MVLFTQEKVNQLLAERVSILRRSMDALPVEDVRLAVSSVTKEFDLIYEVRRAMFHWKLSTKFVLSAINGAGTVTVFVLGGLLVHEGRTDIGTVVAATLRLSRL